MTVHVPAIRPAVAPHIPGWLLAAIGVVIVAVILVIALMNIAPSTQTGHVGSQAWLDYRAGERESLWYSPAQANQAWLDYRAGERESLVSQ